MMFTTHKRWTTLLFTSGFLVMPFVTSATGGETAKPATAQTKRALRPQFRVTGVRDSNSAATVVHCTNLGSTVASVTVTTSTYNGTVDCTMSDDTVGSNETSTLATRDTAFFWEDSLCPTPPQTEQGSLLVSLDTSGSTDVICVVQVIDPTSATPLYLDTLVLYDGSGNLVGEGLIFGDGFETGNLDAWSNSTAMK